MAQDSPTRPHFACVLLFILLLFTPVDGNANGESNDDLTMSVLIKGSVWVTAGDLAEYVRASSVKDKKGNPIKLEDRVVFKEGYSLEVEFQNLDALIKLRKPRPYKAPLSAPIYLGKQVDIEGVSVADLKEKIATVTVPQGKPQLAIEADKSIVCIPQDCRTFDDLIELRFMEEEIKAYAPRPIGMKPIRKKSFELLDRWVSAGEDIRIKVPIPNMDKGNSQLAVGFWTDNPGSKMEDEAYRAAITGIEPEKTGSGIYIVKARVPYLSEIKHVAPDWQWPAPPSVKMTVTVDPGNGQIISETFDLRITRRGWGIAAGFLFILLVLLLIMYVTRNFNPFEKDSNRFTKWQKTYKSSKFIRFFFSPLDIAVTPFGTYSISVTQALFWTFIVAFSCVYVYMLKAAFIVIPNQILLLLGIAGGTALASRINSMSRDVVPKELMIDLQRDDIPRLRDMISIAGRLNIYKFQMLVFTIITGGIVLVELIKASNFPEIPNTLITLMGLSNTLYLGNEVTVEPVQGLRVKVKAYKDEADPKKKKEIGEEIKGMLSQY
jgi:hypothetical protein